MTAQKPPEDRPPPVVLRVQGPPREPKTRSIAEKREDTRARLAIATLVLFGVTVVGAFLLVGFGSVTVEEMLDLMQPIIPAEATLAGATIAFYFGGQSSNGKG